MIAALGKVREQTGREVHFLHTGGAKHYSNHAGMPTDRPLLDTDKDLYETLKKTKSPHDMMATVCHHYYPPLYVSTDTLFLIGSLFKPTSMSSTPLKLMAYAAHLCSLYCIRKGRGIWKQNINPGRRYCTGRPEAATSLQSRLAISGKRYIHLYPNHLLLTLKASKTWPVCHISDTIALYLHIMRKILQGDEIGYGRNGVYFAASGSIVWDVIYSAFARALAKRHYVDDETVLSADDDILQRMGDALDVSPAVVPVLLGGK